MENLVDSHKNQQATPSKAESSPEAAESNAGENCQDDKKGVKTGGSSIVKHGKRDFKGAKG